MKTLPSKELLSEVFNTAIMPQENIPNKVIRLDGNEIIFFTKDQKWGGDSAHRINIYELAHKCKEWAWNNNNGINLSSELTYCSFWRGYKDEIGVDRAIQKTFYADTEPEAIFKACEWIMEQLNKSKDTICGS